MITYTPIASRSIAVFLEGKRVGTIEHLANGVWQYWPKNLLDAGEKFPTLAEVKASLEEL